MSGERFATSIEAFQPGIPGLFENTESTSTPGNSWHALLALRKQTTQAMDGIANRVTALAEQEPGVVKQIELIEGEIQALVDEKPELERTLSLGDYITSHPQKETFHATLVELIIEEDRLRIEYDAIENALTESLPETAALTEFVLTDYESRINYDDFLEEMMSDTEAAAKNTGTLQGLASVRYKLKRGIDSVFTMEGVQDEVTKILADLTQSGHLAQQVPDSPPAQGNLQKNNDISFILGDALKNRYIYRPSYPTPKALGQMRHIADIVTDFMSYPVIPGKEDSPVISPTVDAGIAQFLAKKRNELPMWHRPNSLQHMADYDSEDPVAVSTQGLHSPFDIHGLQDYIQRTYPPLITSHLGAVMIRELSQDEGEEPISGVHTYCDTLGASLIEIDSSFLNRNYETYSDDPDLATFLVQNAIQEVLDHEAGHVMHNTAPDGFLLLWNLLREKEPQYVSSYVGKMEAFFPEVGAREDIAESHMLFLRKPYDLQLLAPGRFSVLSAFYQHIHHDYERFARYQQRKIERAAHDVAIRGGQARYVANLREEIAASTKRRVEAFRKVLWASYGKPLPPKN